MRRAEVLEETGLRVKAVRLLDSCVHEIISDKSVVVIAYMCEPTNAQQGLVASQEHTRIAFVPLGKLGTITLPRPHRTMIEFAISWPSTGLGAQGGVPRSSCGKSRSPASGTYAPVLAQPLAVA